MANSSASSSSGGGPFALLPDDVVLSILAKIETDPRDWARLACVSPRLYSLVRALLCRLLPSRSLPPPLLPSPSSSAAVASLYKLSVCCPGLLRAGVLPEHHIASCLSVSAPSGPSLRNAAYDHSESQDPVLVPSDGESPAAAIDSEQPSIKRAKRRSRPDGAHLASGPWTLSREQGSKLLANRFRDDSLYICDWPGCVHAEQKRKYMIFRGVFKDFQQSGVWRALGDSSCGIIPLDCAFCACEEAWDLHAAFCLKRLYGFHADGEPVVRAYVCKNGHVSGAWTERSLYN